MLACATLTGDDEVTLSHLHGGRGPSDARVVDPLGLRQIYLRQRVPQDEDLGAFLRRLHKGWLGASSGRNRRTPRRALDAPGGRCYAAPGRPVRRAVGRAD